ncbi:MAG: helix-turn-helix domain-containing protein [Ferruginibacter sp.]|nr:helix-turn-helix domain-containing protein [Ferruginibacter sp.]
MFKNLISTKLTFTIILLWVSIFAFAQNERAYESISIAQGLSQGMVYDILQDKEGFIWVGTKDGLNRYDGYTFKVFTNEPTNNYSLSSNSINKLFEDSKGRIWVGTENQGLNIYDKKSGDFLRIKNNPTNANGLSSNDIKFMEEMPDGRMLIAADDGKLNIITLKDNFLDNNVAPIISTIAMPNNTNVYGIGIDKNKNIWIGGMDGTVYKFDATKNNFTLLPNAQLLNNGYLTKSKDILINGNLYLYTENQVTPLFNTAKNLEGNIIFRPNSYLWDRHHRETSFYDISLWSTDKKINWDIKLQSEKRIVYPFIFDKSGLIWCGTVGYGLRKYNVNNDKFNAQLYGYSTYNIIPNTDNDYFIGDVGYRWKRSRNKIVEENAFTKIPQVTQIDNFIIAKNGDYWLKSDNKGYFKYNPVTNKLTPYPSINNYKGMSSKQSIFEDSKNQIWFTGLVGNIVLLNTETEKITTININTNNAKKLSEFAIATAFYEDKNGAYWIGTVDGFATVQLGKTPETETQTKWYYSGNSNALNYNHVSCFLDDPTNANYLWIGTKGGGLNRLEKSTGNFFHLTVKDGLLDNVVYGLLTDDAGNIWGSTNKGVFCLTISKKDNKESWVFRNFTKEDGLQDNEFNTNAYKKMPNGNLAFGGVNGLNIFNPKEILAKNYKPNVFITNILIGNLPVLPNDKTGVLKNSIEQTPSITLNHLQDILTLEFSSLDFTAPQQNKYRYQLVGVDKEWVESGTRRSATYLHLPSGNYIFKVQGSNSQGIWSDKITELKIKVMPPWWRTWWAYLLYALLIGFTVRSYFKFKVNKAKLQTQLNFEQQEAKRIKELDTVKTQLYANITHEFRTPLTVILGMANQVKNDPEKYLDNGVDMIVRNGKNLLNLVNEMLDLSKLEDGKMILNLINGDIIHFLRYIVESFQSLAVSQQKQFHFLADADELIVAYDAEKIRQIITNLLSNALKFTPALGNVYVNISQESVIKKDSTNLVLKIKDTGIGIPENQIQHIFDRFYQLDNSHTRKAEGTGIGLALTKELVKLMDGSIVVKSPPVGATKGTEFIITIPLIKVNGTNTENAIRLPIKENFVATPTEETSYEKIIYHSTADKTTPLILLVEDNVDVVAYTASCLPDYKLSVGKDGKEGFDIAIDIIPDLIITDVMMPFVDGFEMCRKLRQDERTSHIPIIMLTAKADMQSKLEGLEKGADVYLEKPFHKKELLLRIKKLLELRKNLQQYYSKQIGIIESTEILSKETIEPIIEEKAEHEFVKKVREIVEANFINHEFSVEQLCKLIFMSHSQLHRKLDALTGCSPNKFIRIVRLSKAKELLANPTLSIASIALDCGYNDAGYFARVFKQEFGITPQEWRVR